MEPYTTTANWAAFFNHSAIMQYEIIFIGRLLLAMLLGGIIGLERETKNHVAGFRTHMLVTVGSCIFMLISIAMPIMMQEVVYSSIRTADPGRIAAQVVSGIGFLGAGAIMQAKGKVHGLTTAASLWVMAAIGLAVGAGLYLTSIMATLLLFIILSWFHHLEKTAQIFRPTRSSAGSTGQSQAQKPVSEAAED